MQLLNAVLLDLEAALLITVVMTLPLVALWSAIRWWWRGVFRDFPGK